MKRALKRIPIWLLCAAMSGPLLAGKLEKAFTALEVKNYFLARELFQDQVKKHPAAACYGLSVIAGRADNPFFELDSSYAYIQRADAAFSVAPEKERSYIAGSGVTAQTIQAQKEHVFGIAWERAKTLNTLDGYERFILTYPQSAQQAEAVLVRNYMAFQAARTTNTAAAYQEFIDRYPNAKEIYQARSRSQEAVFREAAPNGSEEEYVRFITEHVESPYVRNAEDSLYHIVAPRRSPEELRVFIRKYPKNQNVPDAWRALYAAGTKDLSAASITHFLQENPDYPFIAELSADYRTASLVLYPFRQNGAWGYIDDSGVERIKAQYEFADPFENGQALVGLQDHVGTINKGGSTVVPIEYDDVLDMSEGLATVERADKSGAVDRSGKLVVPMIFDELGEYSGGLAYAAKGGKYGYVDAIGHEVIGFNYGGAHTFKHGAAVVEKDGQQGVIDTKGNVIVPFSYDWVEGYDAAISRVRKDGRMGIIGPFGDVLLGIEHEHVGSFNGGLALVIDKGKCGYVDEKGAFAIPQQYEANEGTSSWGDFHNGVARVMSGGKMALIDVHGQRVFPPQYADIGLMEGDAVPVKKKNKWGYASRAFTTLAEAKYDQAWEMHQGHARVRVGDLFGLIDSTGHEVIAPRFTKLADAVNGLFVAAEASGTGVVDRTGKAIVPLVFATAEVVDARMVKVTRGERSAYITTAGQFIWKEIGFDALDAASPASPK